IPNTLNIKYINNPVLVTVRLSYSKPSARHLSTHSLYIKDTNFPIIIRISNQKTPRTLATTRIKVVKVDAAAISVVQVAKVGIVDGLSAGISVDDQVAFFIHLEKGVFAGRPYDFN